MKWVRRLAPERLAGIANPVYNTVFMPAHLNITMDRALYLRLKKELPPKRISAFIEEAVRARLRPSRSELERAYKAASTEAWRRKLAADWSETEVEEWPE